MAAISAQAPSLRERVRSARQSLAPHFDYARQGIYAACIVIILTLTGIFSSFRAGVTIDDTVAIGPLTLLAPLRLTTLVALYMLGGAAYFAAMRAKIRGDGPAWRARLPKALVAALVVAAALVALMLLEKFIELQFVFTGIIDPIRATLAPGETLQLGPVLLFLARAASSAWRRVGWPACRRAAVTSPSCSSPS